MSANRAKMSTEPHSLGWPAVIVVSLLPLATVAVLYALDVPFGRPDVQVYAYSQRVASRFVAALWPLAAIGVVAMALGKMQAARRWGQRWPFAATMGAVAFLGLWTHLAPPFAAMQHFFNLRSPSHEGAFVLEAERIDSLSEYLADFPSTLQRSPEELKGTRLLGNPPGMTILAVVSDRLLSTSPWLERWIIDYCEADVEPGSPHWQVITRANCAAGLLTIIWIASGLFLYPLARLWLAPAPAAVVTLICFFNPSSASFAPGKDAAQLLTIAVFLWGSFASVERRKWWPAAVGGAALVAGLTLGLIHAWITLIVVASLVWTHRSDRPAWRRLLVCFALPTAGGAAAAIALAWLVWGWNIPATLAAVGASYMRVLDYLGRQPWNWTVAKVPMFALFAGAGVWALACAAVCDRANDAPARLGRTMAAVTVAVMIYSCLQTTLETPRLWLAFVPTLVLGMALSTRTLRNAGSAPPGRLSIAALILLLHLSTTCVQWCLFDARESEWRLLSGRMFE